MKHTPGKWIAEGEIVQAIYPNETVGMPFYHTILKCDSPLVLPEARAANAKLAASAPEMLLVLKIVETELRVNGWNNEIVKDNRRSQTYKDVNALLQKIRGES